MSFEVTIGEYTGPLDLLLELVHKDEIDIWEINISELTGKYIEEIQRLDPDTENMADFIYMASYLLEIKSKMLLPEHEERVSKESFGDARRTLIETLLKYHEIKQLSMRLEEEMLDNVHTIFSDDLFVSLSDFRADELDFSMDKEILQRAYEMVLFNHTRFNDSVNFARLKRERFSVKKKQKEILHRLSYDKRISFRLLFTENSPKSEYVASFLAILKLQQDKRVQTTQKVPFEEIFIRRA